MGFWLQLGVAGFRVDAVPFILEEAPRSSRKPVIHFEYLEEFREFLQWRVGDAVLLGEANVPPDQTLPYFADGEGLHLMFNFWVNQHLFLGLATEDARPLATALQATRRLPPTGQWAHFLRNHDELDLGRLAAADRQTVFDAFGPEPSMQLYGRGIRRRPAPMLGDPLRLRLAYSLVLSLPGTPVLHYGDELGMGEDLRLRDRAAVRTPMQWSVERNAGFSDADSLVRPVVSRGPFAYEKVNVEAQQRDPDSLLRWMTGMIRVRKQCPEIGWGDWRIVPTGSRNVLAIAYTWRGNTIVTVHNLAQAPREAKLRLGGGVLANLVDVEEVRATQGGVHRVPLDAYGYRWFRLGDTNQALAREITG
jgi:maltose alpha-D-glucosyltransferase/alpha-amylase